MTYFKGIDKWENSWHVKINKDGSQDWVRYQRGGRKFIMTQFELFCAVFYAVESVWLSTGGKQFQESGFNDASIQNENLRLFLSDADPFIWADIGSADPAMFPEFCRIIPQKNISLEESYDYASHYIEALPYYYADGVRDAFRTITRCEWDKGVARYMSHPHKGDNDF